MPAVPTTALPEVLDDFPAIGPVINHDQLQPNLTLTLMQLAAPGLQVWTGPPGFGKSIAARYLAAKCNRDYDAGRSTFRAFYFSTGGDVNHNSTRSMKRGIATVFESVLDQELSGPEFRRASELALAEEVIEHLRLMNIQLVIMDEAGTKTEAELRGVAHITNVGIERGWPVTFLLVGMDDLAEKVHRQPAICSRVRRVIVFESWSLADFNAFLVTRGGRVGEAFAKRSTETAKSLARLHDAACGAPRVLETFTTELEARLQRGDELLSATESTIQLYALSQEASLAFAREYQQQQLRRAR